MRLSVCLGAAMIFQMIFSLNSSTNTSKEEKQTCISHWPFLVSCSLSDSKEEAAAIETELVRDYRFGQQQLIEMWGHACALAITKVCTTFITQAALELFCLSFIFYCFLHFLLSEWRWHFSSKMNEFIIQSFPSMVMDSFIQHHLVCPAALNVVTSNEVLM